MQQLLYKINLSEKQRSELNETELTFVNLFNQFRWAYTRDRHPVTIFREMKNPKGHNLIEEMEYMKKYLVGLMKIKPGSVWRGIDWSVSFQKWLLNTEPRARKEDLDKPIKPKSLMYGQNSLEDKIDDRYESYFKKEFVLTADQYKKFDNYFNSLIEGFRYDSVHTYGNLHINYVYQARDYQEEVIRLRIQDLCKQELNIDLFLGYLATRPEKCIDMLIYLFCEFLEGKVIARVKLTAKKDNKKPVKEKSKEKVIDRYVNIKYDEKKVYSLRDIRGLMQ